MVKSSNKNENNNKISKTTQNINIDQIKYSKGNVILKKGKQKNIIQSVDFFNFLGKEKKIFEIVFTEEFIIVSEKVLLSKNIWIK